MRRLATELGAGTMTLYHYVRTKDELLTLVNDAVMGEIVVPEGELNAADWREAITAIARRSRDVLQRHPWLLDIADDPPIGPNSVRHFDQSMHALAALDATVTVKLDIVTAVDEYTFGFCLHERNNLDDESVAEPMKRYIEELVATGEYPHLGALLADRTIDDVFAEMTAHARDPRRFERNLARLLDGFAREFGG
jgi:AcrR family transcriptional regulator